MNRTFWDDIRNAKLRRWVAEGRSDRDMAAELGVSRNAIIRRRNRLGLVTRNKPGQNKHTIKKREKEAPVERAPAAPKLTVITNTAMLVADFIAKNGVRRFGARDRADYDSVKRFLEERGYGLNGFQGKHRVSQPGRGRPRLMAWPQVIDFVDKLRAAEGLQTIRRRA